MIVHPQFLSARRQEVHDHIAALYSRHVCPAVRENAIHEASAEFRRLDVIEGWVRGVQETAAETIKPDEELAGYSSSELARREASAIHAAHMNCHDPKERKAWEEIAAKYAAERLLSNRRRAMTPGAATDAPRRVLPMLTTGDVVVFPGERRRGL